MPPNSIGKASFRNGPTRLEAVLLCLHPLRDPGSAAAHAFEHVKCPPGWQVQHTGSELRLLAATQAFRRIGFWRCFFHAANDKERA
jgi:hypothetical protein